LVESNAIIMQLNNTSFYARHEVLAIKFAFYFCLF